MPANFTEEQFEQLTNLIDVGARRVGYEHSHYEKNWHATYCDAKRSLVSDEPTPMPKNFLYTFEVQRTFEGPRVYRTVVAENNRKAEEYLLREGYSFVKLQQAQTVNYLVSWSS
jgi:hypothetical protein